MYMCIRNVIFTSVFTIFRLHIGIVLTVWYFLIFNLILLGIHMHARLVSNFFDSK
jgi:hypothetical protein